MRPKQIFIGFFSNLSTLKKQLLFFIKPDKRTQKPCVEASSETTNMTKHTAKIIWAVIFLAGVLIINFPVAAGDSIRDAQQNLKTLGYDPGPIDGLMGLKTKKALKAFQKEHGITATGEYNSETKAKLNDTINLISINSSAKDMNIKITSLGQKISYSSKTVKTADGTFQMLPDENSKTSGYIKINYNLSGVAKSLKSEVKNIFKLGGDYFYYFFDCNNGNSFQSLERPYPSISPIVLSIKDYNELDLNAAMQMYKTGDLEQQESAVWIVWKLEYGKQTEKILKDLVNGNDTEKISAAMTISEFRIYHPLINHAVQRRLLEMQYKPGSLDGILSDNTITAIKQFQKDHDIKITGWLDEQTLIKLFNKRD